MTKNCIVTKLIGDTNDNSLPIYNSVKVQLFNTSGVVNTGSMINVAAHSGAFKIQVVEGSVDVYADNSTFIPKATGVTNEYVDTESCFIQGNAIVWIEGKNDFVGISLNNSAQIITNDDYFEIDLSSVNYTKDFNVFSTGHVIGTLELKTIQNIQNFYFGSLIPDGNYCFDFTDYTAQSLQLSGIFHIAVNGTPNNSEFFKNLNINILENVIGMDMLQMPFQNSITGDVNTLCDRLFANGKVSGQIIFSLCGTKCTYNGDELTPEYGATYGWSIIVTFTQNGWTAVLE